jgi:hypothetical protein
VQLQTWELNANLYDGASTAGPVPTIFSDDQQATIDALVGDPAQAHKDVVKINRYTIKSIYYLPNHYSLLKANHYITSPSSCSIFVMPEVIKAAACGSIIKKPRSLTPPPTHLTFHQLKKLLSQYTSYTPISLVVREGTGIQKFKRGRWSTSDESPPKKKKSDTDSGTAHFAFKISISHIFIKRLLSDRYLI